MSMSSPSLRLASILSVFACAAAAGCKDKYEMVTAALDSVSVSEGLTTDLPITETSTGTGGGTESGGTTSDPPTTSNPTTSNPTTGMTGGMTTSTTGGMTTTGTSGWDPSETTGAPAMCTDPEDCTGKGSGDFGPLVMPFFRGEVCAADKLRPGDMLPISFNPCVHPCVDPKKYGWRYLVRCTGGVGCELGFLFYYREATGMNCPEDVFGKFNADACKYIGPHKALTQALVNFGNPEDKLTIPFITNEDAAAASMMEPNAEVWMRIDGYTQSADRYFPLDVSDQNAAPPMECGPGVPGCTCKQIGF